YLIHRQPAISTLFPYTTLFRSTRSKVFQNLDVTIDQLPLQELITLIQKNPGLLRRPIIIDDKRLQVGYNEDEIRRFLPRTVRTLDRKSTRLNSSHVKISYAVFC